MYEDIFNGGENSRSVKVTTKLPLVERLGKNCDETVLRHMALLGVAIELHFTFASPAICTHALSSFQAPSIDLDSFDSQHSLALLCCNYFEQF
jgi:hypothetical protein